MKANQIFVYLIYVLLLSAITFFSIISASQKPKFYTEKKIPIANDDLGRVLLEYSITAEEHIYITEKLGFFIVKIKISGKDSVEEVLDVYDELSEDLLNISQNFYTKSYKGKEKLFEILKNNKSKLEGSRIEDIERMVNLELLMQDPNKEYLKIKNRLSKIPEVYSINLKHKYLPVIIFFVLVLVIFHFSKSKIIKSIKKF